MHFKPGVCSPHINYFFAVLLLFYFYPVVGVSGVDIKALREIYQHHPYTFFCNQPFHREGFIDLQNCKTCPFLKEKIRWMPIVSYQQLASHLICFKEKICTHPNGQRFKGLKCCLKQNEMYERMSQDLHNFVPEISTLKQSRRHYHFGMIEGKTINDNSCHFFIDQKRQLIDPAPQIRGMIGRTYLYMRDKYHLPFPQEKIRQYYSWHEEYPASEWEKERNAAIKKIQGDGNPYI